MPLGDKTGPRGQGPKTGRGVGTCAGYDHPGYLDPNINEDRRGLRTSKRKPRLGINLGRRVSDLSQSTWSDGPPD